MKKENSTFLKKLTISILNEVSSFFAFRCLTGLGNKTEDMKNKTPNGRQLKKIASYFVLQGVLASMSTTTPDRNATAANPIVGNSLCNS